MLQLCVLRAAHVRPLRIPGLGFEAREPLSRAASSCNAPTPRRCVHTEVAPDHRIPLRKRLKDAAKAKKVSGVDIAGSRSENAQLLNWELTVGVEVHAQLNTEHKLFSTSTISSNDAPNTHVSLFDLAFPGSQPVFQKATLVPAVRAAVALNCEIQTVSRFDRKHYFYHDQPAGYQITQYYEPFAKAGHITLGPHDGIDPSDGESVTVGIKQIQMEQDTAKSQEQDDSTHLLDFNRVGHPLIEIITLPQIHSPATAAACVRKIQGILMAVDAVTTGMEMGGLRADINVSVRRRNAEPAPHSYHGVTGLGQRTEIKNLSSFKAVEDAIMAERDRQITVLEAGGVIEGETRGWSIGSTETKKLRGKEGEVDYRYMPDPDIGPVVIGDDLLDHICESLPPTPDELLEMLCERPYGLSGVDAKILIDLDDGTRLDYYQDVVERLQSLQAPASRSAGSQPPGQLVGNWVLHELGSLLAKPDASWDNNRVSVDNLAQLLDYLMQARITGQTAKRVLKVLYDGDARSTTSILDEENLFFRPMSEEEYVALAKLVLAMNEPMVKKLREKGQTGKIMWFVGQMMRQGEEGRVEAKKAEEVLKELILH